MQIADDSAMTVIAATTQSIGQVLTDSCSIVSYWMLANKLKLNADKTHLITVGTAERLIGPCSYVMFYPY